MGVNARLRCFHERWLTSDVYLATAPAVRPMARRARVLYAAAAGALTAIFQLYLSVSWGPYLALLAASLLTPLMDRWFRPRALVGS